MKCKLTDISKSYHDRIILDHISYDFSANGMYILSGKSGIGKTTLLNILCGYETSDSGLIETEGSQVVYALQNYELLDMMSVADNLKICETLYPNSFDNPIAYMKALKVDHLLNQYPNELSKGQKQRIMIVKALCRKADIYLFDEPTSALDKESAQAVTELLYEKAKTATVIVVTHDLTHMIENQTTLLEIQKGKLIEKSHHKKDTDNHHHTVIKHSSQQLKPIMKRILKKQSNKMMILYSLFAIVMITMLFINVHRYQWKTYGDLYESDYLYIRDTSDYERTMKKSGSIINFLDYDTGTTTFPLHVVPSHHEQDQERLKNGGVIINQNTAQFFANQWGIKETEVIGKTISLDYSDGSYRNEIAFTIIDVIEEKDAHTRAMVYYDKEDTAKRMEHYDEIGTSLYEIKANPDYIEKLYQDFDDQGSEVFHPMLSDKTELSQQGSAEDIILWLLIGIIYVFYLLFIYITCQNHWKYHLTSNMILINDGVSCDTLKSIYQNIYDKKMLTVSALSISACMVCYVIEFDLIFIIFAISFVIPYILNHICIRKNAHQLQKHKIADLLKASQEVK